MTTFHFNVPLSLCNSCVWISYLDLFSKTCDMPNITIWTDCSLFLAQLISSMIEVKKFCTVSYFGHRDVTRCRRGAAGWVSWQLGLAAAASPRDQELHQVLPRGLPAMPAASQLLLNRSSVRKTELCRGRRCDGAWVIVLVMYTRCEWGEGVNWLVVDNQSEMFLLRTEKASV